MKIFHYKKQVVHLIWAFLVIGACYLATTYTQIKEHVTGIMMSEVIYLHKSGAIKHDARISVIFRYHSRGLSEIRNRPIGKIVYAFYRLKWPATKEMLDRVERGQIRHKWKECG